LTEYRTILYNIFTKRIEIILPEKQMKIAMTGASGNMGREVLAQTLELSFVECVKVLLSPKKKNDKLAKVLKKQYKNRIEIVRGSVADKAACEKLVKGTDYVLHMAAVIPPASDASYAQSKECNLDGAVAIVNAVKNMPKQAKYIHISTVALYGNRNQLHPWGRVGDPLLISPFDAYALHKLEGERYALEAGLDCWVVLRQTAMLHPNMMHDNISDGLMYHTAMNAPLEWVSSRDSGYLLKRIFERDHKGEADGFWKKIYNIGAGIKGRETGYDTFGDGFGIIGGSAEKFFKPNWLAARNFHGLWFADGDELEKLFSYQRDDVHEYWKEIGRHHKIYKLGKCVPKKLIHACLFGKLLKHPNAPMQWVKSGDRARVQAYFGGEKAYAEIPEKWDKVKLMARGDYGNYDELRDAEKAKARGMLLKHGYDENKPETAWTKEDYQSAAKFRGGEFLEGDKPYEKAKWRCSEGHAFELNPYSVLRGGHWCPVCAPKPWIFDRLAKKSPYYAQVWYDSHTEDEYFVYDMDETGKADVTEDKE